MKGKRCRVENTAISRITGRKQRWIYLPSGLDFGKSDFPVERARLPGGMLLPLLLIGVFIIIAFLGDLWPVKNVSEQCYAYVHRGNINALSMDFNLVPSMRYSFGSAARYYNSLAYLALVKVIYYFIPFRLLSLRILSILSTSIALLVLYRLTVILFCRAIGLLLLVLLVISPSCLENFRAFGYGPLTNMVVCGICYLLVLSLNRRKTVIKAALLSLLAYATLSLYVIGRLIIFLPLMIFVLYFKRYWLHLVIFIGLLICLVLILDYSIGDTHFDIKKSIMINSEWLKAAHVNTPIDADALWGRFNENFAWALRYIAIKHSPLYDAEEGRWLKPEALINVVYWPFLCIGLLVCLIRRKTSNIILLFWFFLLGLVPMLSSWIPVRRFMLALTPIYLFIAIGLWWVYNLFLGLPVGGKIYRRWLNVLVVISLTFIGGYNLYIFFSEAAKPEFFYSRRQLKELTTYIAERGRSVKVIRYNSAVMDLIWGNPYFDRPQINRGIINKIQYDREKSTHSAGPKSGSLIDQIEYSRREGGNILYIHAIEHPDPFVVSPSGGDKNWPNADIEWVKKNMGQEATVSELPGIDGVYFLYVKEVHPAK